MLNKRSHDSEKNTSLQYAYSAAQQMAQWKDPGRMDLDISVIQAAC